MSSDRYERRHRFTDPSRRETNLTAAPAAPNETLAQAMGVAGRPANLVAEINGHHIYRDEATRRFHLFTPGEGWWGFDIPDENYARRICEAAVAPSAHD